MGELDFSKIPFDLIVNILNIAVLYVIVRQLAYKPVKKFLAARQEKLTALQEQTAKIQTEAEALRQQYTEKLQEGEKEYRQIVAKGEETAREKAEKILQNAHAKETEAGTKAALILEDAQAEADSIRRDAQEKAEAAKKEALQTAKTEIVELSLQIASRLMERNLDDADNRRLADAFFEASCNGETDGPQGEKGGRA